jgi:hypothetical protein
MNETMTTTGQWWRSRKFDQDEWGWRKILGNQSPVRHVNIYACHHLPLTLLPPLFSKSVDLYNDLCTRVNFLGKRRQK